MKKSMVIAVALLAAIRLQAEEPIVAAAATDEVEKAWSVTVATEFDTRYLFRGVDLLNHPVSMSSVTATWKELTGYVCQYFGRHNDGTYSETDIGVEYKKALDKLTITGGAVGYVSNVPEITEDTAELYASMVYDRYLQPALTLNWDVVAVNGGYLSLSIRHEYDMSQPLGLPESQSLTIAPFASTGFNLEYTSTANTMNDVLLGINTAWTRGRLTIAAGYSLSLALEALKSIDQGQVQVGRCAVSWDF